MAELMTLTDATFDEVIGSRAEPVLVDFWAEWCGPCKMVAPILEQLAAEHTGRLAVAKLNIDENLATARRFEVLSIPTLILFANGEEVLRIVGAESKARLAARLEPYLAPAPS
jgi:thioredoxin 1